MFEKLIQKEILSSNEVRTYKTLLQKGPQYLAELTDLTKIKRSTLADALQSLIEKNLVTIEKRARPLYKPKSPEILQQIIQTRRKDLSDLEDDINTRLPESLKKAQGVYPPLSLAYIASFLESNGVEVEILDVIALNLTTDETREHIKNQVQTLLASPP